jgi:hypothetical protein
MAEAEVPATMGNVPFANEFAGSLWGDINSMQSEAKTVTKECIARKHAMDQAVIGL